MLYLIGVPGHPNYGDEFIARSWLRWLADRAPDVDVWLDCPNPGNAQALLHAAHPRLRCTDTLWRLCAESPTADPWETVDYVRRAIADPGLSPRWSAGLDVLRSADHLHLLGGGYLNSVWPRQYGVLGGLAALADRGVRTAATGQGLVPARDQDVPLLRGLLARVGYAEVRDRGSADVLGVAQWGLDDAWLDPGPVAGPAARQLADDLDVVLCLQTDMHGHDVGVLAAHVVRQLETWAVDPARVALIECIPRQDRPVFDALQAVLPLLRFVPWLHVWRDGLPAAPHQRWISTRFHPHLLAGAAGAWGTAISVSSDYYRTKHCSLLDIGSDWAIVEPGASPVQPPATGSGLSLVADSLRAAKQQTAAEVYGWMTEQGPESNRSLPPGPST